ncbi:MAG: hypothetical protein ACYC3S_11595 [Chloroflexota bacterium]
MDAARMQILEAIEARQITAREGARLLDALAGQAGKGEKVARLRVMGPADERARVDVRLALPVLEAFANLGLDLGSPWGVAGMLPVADVLAAVRAGAEGIVAEAEDERGQVRVELSLEMA